MAAEKRQRFRRLAFGSSGPANIRRVRTVIFSDLHLGATTGNDVVRNPRARQRLLEAAADADRVVMLGDMLELRELPLGEVLRLARPFFDELAEAIDGKRLLLVPGNHDYQLAEPFLTRYRLDPGGLPTEGEWSVEAGDGVAGRLAEWMPEVELTLGYPGVRLRPDVWATHGHYLDVHLTIPRLETIFAGALGRLTKRGRDCRSTGDYEAVLSPIYSFNNALAQGVSPRAVTRGASLSRTVWSRANGAGEGGALGRFVLAKLAIPGGVAALNLTGLGPFGYDISGAELRRTGLRSMARVVTGLGIDADHVIFGHSHRRGPEPGDEPAEWRLPDGTRLWNSGTWYYERVLMGRDRQSSPYWPGTVTRLGDEGPPELDNVLRDVSLRA
jgi:calcineurin-like phosphoesterase family protein